MKEPPTNHHRRRLNRKSKNNPKELFNGEDIHKAGNLKDLHHHVIDVDNLHAALFAHNLLGGEQNTKTGGPLTITFWFFLFLAMSHHMQDLSSPTKD